jgi:hypothetical protein
MNRVSVLVAIFAVVTQLVVIPLSDGAEVTRAQYVEHGEPICKANTIANSEGIRQDVREGRLKVAGSKFSRAARALDLTIQRLEHIPRPATDEALLTRWFTHLNSETQLLAKVASQLRQGSSVDLGRYVLELRHESNVTNNIVLTFGFEFCLIQTARYI